MSEGIAGGFLKRVLSRPIVKYGAIVGVFVLAAFAVQVWCGALTEDDMRVRGVDPVEYYVYLPSVFFDGDVNFFNEFFHYGAGRLETTWTETATGYRKNRRGIGMAVAQAPFFGAAYVVLAIKSGHFPLPVTFKYDPLFEHAWYIGNIFWFAISMVLIAIWLGRFIGIEHSLAVAVFFFLATPILYYSFPIAPMAHGVSLASIVLFLLCLSKCETNRGALCYLFAGALLGFAITVRPTNVVFVVFFLAHWALQLPDEWRHHEGKRLVALKRPLKRLALAALGLAVALLPYLVVLSRVFGEISVNPYEGESAFALRNIISVAFSTKHGFITWHPILFVGLAGLFVAAFMGQRRRFAVSGLVAVLAIWILMSTSNNWWAGWSFGHRIFIEVYPFFALSIGILVDALLRQRRWFKTAAVCIVGLASVIWNVLFMVQYKAGLIPRGEALSMKQYLWDKLDLCYRIITGGPILPT